MDAKSYEKVFFKFMTVKKFTGDKQRCGGSVLSSSELSK